MTTGWPRGVDTTSALSSAPLVSVVIPTRNESYSIEACLDAVLGQDWPHSSLEVIVADGCSDDGTTDIAKGHAGVRGLVRFEVVDNAQRSTPSNLNLGLAHARGRYVCRVDARSLIPATYIRRCVETLQTRPEVAVVGGRQVAIQPTDGGKGRGIARALNNRYTMGMSRYRRGAESGLSDTVYLGFFRVEDLREVGGWDERLATNQDFDLNHRLSAKGLVWFDAALEVGYVPRHSFGALFRQYRRFGEWKVTYWCTTGDRPRPRQIAALAVLPGTVLAGLSGAIFVGRRLGRVGIGALAGAAAIGVLAVEQAGATGPAGPVERIASLTASMCVAGGWSTGAWSRLLGDSATSNARRAA